MDKINMVVVTNVANTIFNNLYIMAEYMTICLRQQKEEGMHNFFILICPYINIFFLSPFTFAPNYVGFYLRSQ